MAAAAANTFRLDRRIAVVTGAASGIGREIALTFARGGARVACVDVDAEGLATVVQEIGTSGAESLAAACDVSRPEDVEAAFAQVDDRFGAVDVLVNDAFVSSHTRPQDIELDEWERVLDVNVTGYMLCARAAARRMIRRGTGGAIVNLSSIASSAALGRGNFAYSVSKGAIDALTRELAIEWAPFGIRVNAIKPCQVETPGLQTLIDDPKFDSDTLLATWLRGIPLGRLARPDDIAAAALYLASDAARMVTGVLLPVDGGNLAMNAGGTVGW
jgi:NAD(P)-dependent dehydrogenase (short-subunit alcohol dehydrogenase family)